MITVSVTIGLPRVFFVGVCGNSNSMVNERQQSRKV
jgi:hypothetical protein